MTRLGPFVVVLFVTCPVGAQETLRPALSYLKSIGGTGNDAATAVALDKAGTIYVTGTTTSLDFPIVNGLQKRFGGAFLRSSYDAGKTWIPSTINAPVYAVNGSRNQAGVLYAGTSSGVFKSSDSGKTWRATPLGGYTVNALVVDDLNPDVVYAGTAGGVLKSRDGGASWELVGQSTWNVILLVASAGQPSTLFASVDSLGIPNSPSLYRSTDAGASWSLLSNSPIGTIALACDPLNPLQLYAGANSYGFSGGGAGRRGVYRSSDAGNTWTLLEPLPIAISTLALAASPTSVYAATDNGVMRSRDHGATWSQTPVNSVADNVAVDPDHPEVVYANAAAIFTSQDGGSTWSSVLDVRQNVQTIYLSHGSPSIVFVGASPGQNIFVSKLSPDGKQLLYSTYLGGSYYDVATGISVDDENNAYVTGYTYSTDFPTTSSAFQANNRGVYNAFLSKIDSGGGTLLYSTYLGGSTGDSANAVALDHSGNAYLTGYAGSTDFPVTSNAPQLHLLQDCALAPVPLSNSRPNKGDAFVAKINLDRAELNYATFLGGSCADEGLGITVDPGGNAYVVGATTSPDFPTSSGGLRQTYGGGQNTGFLAKLTPQGDGVSYASYIGGNGDDVATAVSLDVNGNVYVSGSTFGFDQVLFGFPPNVPTSIVRATWNPLVRPGVSFANSGAAYLLKLDPSAAARVYVKYLGGNSGMGRSIAIDHSGRVWVAGTTAWYGPDASIPFPTVHPFQAEVGNGFVTQLSSDGTEILFSSLTESANKLALDSPGNAFLVGITEASETYKYFYPSAALLRVDTDVPSAVTIEEPQRTVAETNDFHVFPGIAPGEIVSLAGTGLGPDQEIGAQLTPDGQVATSLSGTTVTFGGVPAALLSVQSKKVVCIVPLDYGNQTVYPNVQVQRNGSFSNTIQLAANETAVEVLSVLNTDGTANSASHPAAPGSTLVIYAAGFGQTEPPSVNGQINGVGKLSVATVVLFGEQTAEILYAGPAPGQVAGITQINVRVPNLPPSQYMLNVGSGPFEWGSDYNATSVSIGIQ
ncbi:MAG TPA: SBBP repeat-containing protein [Bryobacteraceae bacterium]|jgi:uncharacterized protein (TIGR03437 family)